MAEKSLLQRALEKLADANSPEMYEARVQSYSGRGMNGRSCLAVRLDDERPDLFRLGVAVASAVPMDTALLLEEIGSARTDSLGRGTILYWPQTPYAGEGE